MNPQNEAFTAYLNDCIAKCAQHREQLLADHRVDEANFEKVRENIYDVFRTVFYAAQKTQNPHLFFLQKLEEIPANWQASYQKAQEYGDTDKMHLEQLKLDVAHEIKAEYLRLQGDAL